MLIRNFRGYKTVFELLADLTEVRGGSPWGTYFRVPFFPLFIKTPVLRALLGRHVLQFSAYPRAEILTIPIHRCRHVRWC